MESPFGEKASYARFTYRAPKWQSILDRIDVEALVFEWRRYDRPSGLYVATLDTSFFYSGFQSAIRWGGFPKSIEAARDGVVRLFMAEETFLELIDILPEFAEKLRVEEQLLKAIVSEWSPWIWIVNLYDIDDPRVDRVTERHYADRPAARLAAFLSPCFLLTTDKDFEAMEVKIPCQPIFAIKAAVQAKGSEAAVQVMGAAPAVPALAVWEGAKWGGAKLGVHPLLLIIVAIALGYAVYRFQPEDRQARIRSAVKEGGRVYMNALGSALEKHQLAERAVNAQSVPRLSPHTPESRVIGELARQNEPMSAQRLYGEANLRNQISVRRIREVLRCHESTRKCPGNGQWSFGIPLDEYLGAP